MTPDNSLSIIIENACQGVPASWDALSQLVQNRLIGYIFRHVGTPDERDDIMQEVQLALVQSLAQLHDLNRFWPWVYRIAGSKIQQHYRKQRQFQIILKQFEATHKLKPDRFDVLDTLVIQERIKRLESAIRELPDPQREMICLRGLQKLSYQAIADQTATFPKQARVRYFRACQKLKKILLLYGC